MIKSRTIALLLLAWVTVASGPLLADEATGFAPRQAVVLLNNGELLRGKVSLAGDQYFVWVPEGEIRLPVKRVQGVCDTVDDAYLYLARSSMGSIDDHLELAAWCLRYELFGYAAKELSAAMELDADHPRVALFARRLELAQAKLKRRSVESEPTPADSTAETGESEQGAVVLDLPEGGIAEFTSRLQPLLMNKCATAGCHGPSAASSFRLSGSVGSRIPTRRQTQQNLIAVLQHIDKQDPQNSPLLLKPRDPTHGGLTAAIFSDQDQAQYDRLVEFVNLVSEKPLPTSAEESDTQTEQPPVDPFPAEMRRPEPGANPPDAAQGLETSVGTVPTEIGAPPSGEAMPIDTLSDEEILEAFEATPIQRGAVIDSYTPIDEFDAEIFNRRFFPESRTSAGESPEPK